MSGIYIHIPFCKSKCYYCNFYSIVSLRDKNVFIDALLHEADIRKDYLNQKSKIKNQKSKDRQINTIYIGGGTPSLLNSNEMNRIIEKLYMTFEISTTPEITIEINPDDIDVNKVKELKSTSVNRISLGVQSFHDEDLKYLKRIHNAEQSLNSIRLLQNEGYENITVDFIFGIPTLTSSGFRENLEKAVSLNIPHISAYALTVEPGTALNTLIKKGKVKPPPDEKTAEHFKLAMEYLGSKGFQHYEISNYCKEGYISKHNSNYWLMEKYLGLGPSAHSYNIDSRQWNVSNVNEYIKRIEKGIIPAEQETLSAEQKYNEYIMLSLRTIWGCDTNYIKQNFGNKIYDVLLSKCDPQLKDEMLKIQDGIIYLSEKGKLFADRIASEFFIIK